MSNNSEASGPKPDIESSLKSKGGGHGYTEKRGGVQGELRQRLQALLDQLPEHSKIVIAREIRQSGEDIEQAIVRIQREIDIRKEIVEHLKHSGDPKAALKEVQEIIPEQKIQ